MGLDGVAIVPVACHSPGGHDAVVQVPARWAGDLMVAIQSMVDLGDERAITSVTVKVRSLLFAQGASPCRATRRR
jgi:hypothetical protein